MRDTVCVRQRGVRMGGERGRGVVTSSLLKQTTVFNVSFLSFGNSMILPAALSEIFLTWSSGVFRVANADLVALSHMYRGWWASFSAHFWTSGTCFCVYDVDTATIRTICSRSGIC